MQSMRAGLRADRNKEVPGGRFGRDYHIYNHYYIHHHANASYLYRARQFQLKHTFHEYQYQHQYRHHLARWPNHR